MKFGSPGGGDPPPKMTASGDVQNISMEEGKIIMNTEQVTGLVCFVII